MTGLFRVNARIGQHHNDFLDAESERTGLSKSMVIMLAIENYMNQNQQLSALSDLVKEAQKLANEEQE